MSSSAPPRPLIRLAGMASAIALVATLAVTTVPLATEANAQSPDALSPAVLIDELTGPEATTNTRDLWNVGYTDLGVMWDDGTGNVLAAFGDTFRDPGANGAGVNDWRSNVLLRSSDSNLSDGMSFDWALTGDDGNAVEIFGSDKVDGEEITTIPTAGIAVGGRQYLDYMSVRTWGEPGQWDTNFAQLAYSDDGGATWSTDGAPRFDNNADGTDPMQMKAFARHDGHVYIFGTPNGRLGSAHLAKVPEGQLLDLDAWTYWDGRNFVADYDAVTPVVEAPVSEMSVRHDPATGLWQMIHMDANADLVLRTAQQPEGPWSDGQVLVTQQDYPGLYGGFIHPWSPEGEIYFALSMWDQYNVALMKVTVDGDSRITRGNVLIDPSIERSGALNVTNGWTVIGQGGVDTQADWAKVGRRQFWVRHNSGEHLMVQAVTVTANTDYRLTGWLRTGDTVGGNAGEGRVGARAMSDFTVLGEQTFGDLHGWNRMEVEFNTGNNTQIQVYAGSTMTGDRWVQGDDFALVPIGEPGEQPVPPDEAPPGVVPTLDNWTAGKGKFTLTRNARIVGPADFADSAELLAREIGTYRGTGPAQYVTGKARGTDISIVIDGARASELGEEGYRLEIKPNGVTITGATKEGAFYGTRTLSQMLRQSTQLASGSTVDIPKYPERGVTVSAYEINIADEWIERMLVEMADLKLNQILLQIKVKSDEYPGLNTWSYYPKEQVREFVELANSYGIDVIPEINAPGHMSVVLENYPEYQLIDDNGVRQPNQLDVCNEEAVAFYKDLVDEYIEVFQPKQWHMGSDEYMLGKDPNNYTRLQECANERFGAGATINDVVFDFINDVNAHVKAQGLSLRIWNDGLLPSAKVVVDSDVTIEYWIDWAPNSPAQRMVDRGHKVMNASMVLYDTRWPNEERTINASGVWNSGWNAGDFWGSDPGVDPDDPNLVGIKASLWPDNAWAQTENHVEARVRDGLRVTSQLAWRGHRSGLPWNQFKAVIDDVGRSPEWTNVDDQSLAAGSYVISLHGDATKTLGHTGTDPATTGSESWVLTPTPDRYYQIRSSMTGQCLTMRDGFQTLGVVTEIGAAPGTEDCGSATDQSMNRQKWQIVPDHDGGMRITSAVTNQVLAITKGHEVRPHRYLGGVEYPETTLPAGKLAQLPGDMTSDRWDLIPAVGVTAEADRSLIWAGEDTTVSLAITNDSGRTLTDVQVASSLPDGWEIVDVPAIPDVAAGESVDVDLVVRDVNAAPGRAFLPFVVTHGAGRQASGLMMEIACGEPVSPDYVGVDSEQTWGEPGGNGPGRLAVDGDPLTYWHTSWAPNDPYPHWLAVDTGSPQAICGVSYLPRHDENSGRVADFEFHVSPDGQNWGDPVASGTMERRFGWHQIRFDEGTAGRYIRFTGLNAPSDEDVKGFGNPWMAVAELTYSADTGIELLPGYSTAPAMAPSIVETP